MDRSIEREEKMKEIFQRHIDRFNKKIKKCDERISILKAEKEK